MLQRVLSYVRHHRLMRPGDRVGVAVSGGADSVALLRLLLEARAELGIVLSVIHFNHKIRGADSDADEQFARQLARGFDLEFRCGSGDTPTFARERKLSLEAAARTLRYAFFDRLTADSTVHRVATAHTRDDQAETVLMRLLRGAGTKGLSGIHPGIGGWISASVTTSVRKPGESQSATPPPAPRIVRPLLEITREELREYLRSIGQSWCEDASNLDVNFTRNRLRHEVMPVLRQLNPNLDAVLSDMAEVARAEENWWNSQLGNQQDIWKKPDFTKRTATGGLLEPFKMRVDVLLSKPMALQRRLVRMIEHDEFHLDFAHVEAVLALAASEPSRAERVLELPHGWEAVRSGSELWFRRGHQPDNQPQDYDLPLAVPGEVEVAGTKLRAAIVTGEDLARAGEDAHTTRVLLASALAHRQLCVRNWRPGDRYWPSHTRQSKKVKELLQARHIPREQKPFWPVIISGDDIVWLPGFVAPEQFRFREGDLDALLLEEVPLGQTGENEQ